MFLTFEGVDGAGKSTHIEWVANYLRQAGVKVLVTREPGGTPVGEKLRQLLLTESMHLQTETLLMFAARCEHVRSVIEPALQGGKWVVCDRFTDATFAYQGGGRELGFGPVQALQDWVHPSLRPDRTWLFDLDLAVARQRLAGTRSLDRFEKEDEEFFTRTRNAYHALAANEPERFLTIDSSQTINDIRSILKADLDQLLQKSGIESGS